jgi:L-fuconate dehydratase
VIRNGRYMPPENPGYSAALKPASRTDHTFPTGTAWTGSSAKAEPN